MAITENSASNITSKKPVGSGVEYAKSEGFLGCSTNHLWLDSAFLRFS